MSERTQAASRRVHEARAALDAAGTNYVARRKAPGTQEATLYRARSEWGTALFEWCTALHELAAVEDSERAFPVPPRVRPSDGLRNAR